MIGRLAIALGMAASLGACGKAPIGLAAGATARGFHVSGVERPAEATLPSGTVSDTAALSGDFTVMHTGEGLLRFTASAQGADWEDPVHQEMALRVILDGFYNQDVILATQNEPFEVELGALPAGPHHLRFERLASASSAAVTQASVTSGEVAVVTPTDPEYPVYSRAPILLGRPECYHTDAPVALFYNDAPVAAGRRVTYTYMFTNEDGGTDTRALMARWGRTVDIDWAYALDLDASGRKAGHETYQGALHITHDFKGKYEGNHPIVRDATKNNNYDDGGTSPLRFRLAPSTYVDTNAVPREWVLDQHPWIYALAAKELFREGKAVKEDPTVPGPMDPRPRIADPRRFLFVDFQLAYGGRGIGVAVKLKNYAQPFLSYRGDGGLTVQRSGWVRAAVELPRAITAQDVERMDLVGVGGDTSIAMGVRQVMTLDADFLPVVYPITWSGNTTFNKEGQVQTFYEADRPAP